jgi:cell fate regulator YaaT (PSP1 superfamily)
MLEIVPVNFRRAGKLYYFDPAGLALRKGDTVIVETQRGVDMGEVKADIREVAPEQVALPLRRVVRVATPEDFARREANQAKEQSAQDLCRRRIEARVLPMKLLTTEYAFDGNQVMFYFAAEGRVDFRELVKDLAAVLRTRIQLHQVGARDAAKLLGGIGPCGRGLCCATWLTTFEPISMKMAKEQSLFLNPTKFSGACGKLMCCLRYEYDSYRETKARLPAVGTTVTTPRGQGKVVGHNVIREWVIVEIPDMGPFECRADEVQTQWSGPSCASGGGCSLPGGSCSAKKSGKGSGSDGLIELT